MRVDLYNLWKEHRREFDWRLIHGFQFSYAYDPKSKRYFGLHVNEVFITFMNFQIVVRWG